MPDELTPDAIEQAPELTPDDVIDHDAILDELAKLSLIAYDQRRRDTARVLVHLHRSVCAFSWERHAPAWLLEPGWSPAFPGTKALAQEVLRKCTSSASGQVVARDWRPDG